MDYSMANKVATGIIMALLTGAIGIGFTLLDRVSSIEATVVSDSEALKELRDRVLQHQIYGPHGGE